MRSDFLPVLLLGFVFGITLGSFFDFGYALPVFFILLGAILLAYPKRSSVPRGFFIVSLFFLALALGFLRMKVETYRYENILAPFVGKHVVAKGVVAEYPDTRETNTRFIVEPKEIFQSGATTTASGYLMVISDLYPGVHYGDKVALSGIIKPVKNLSPSDTNFDYKKYLSKDGVFNEMLYPKISILSVENGNPIVSKLFLARDKFSEKLRENIREPEASLGLGMLIGEKHALPKSLLDVFKRAGIIHLVVLSGYNIALVSQFFTKIFSFLPILYRTSAGGVAILLFVLMTGGGASAIRAAIMAIIALIGIATGRTYDAGRALFVAGFLMVLENPNVLIFDPSFQLSFLATLGLIYLSPIISARLGKWKPAGIRELLAQTLSTQIVVLPLLVYLSGAVSIVALPVNLLVLPSVPFAMIGSFVTGIAGFLGSTIAMPFALFTSTILSHTIVTAEFFASLPFASLLVGSTSAWFMISLYIILIVVYFLIRPHAKNKK